MALIFDHFSFRYDGAEREALQDIALKIDQGEFVVLVGSGGSGKLHITVVTTSFLSLHTAGSGIKILDLTGNTAAEFGGVKFSNGSDAAFASQ